MAVYVDDMQTPFGLMRMCHMVADTLDELHEMAERIGMVREWFQNKPSFPHYDLSQSRKQHAIELGARQIKRRQLPMLVARIEVSGGFGEFGDLGHGRKKLDFYTRRELRHQSAGYRKKDPAR